MTFEVCGTCGQSHPQVDEHRTLQGEWCTPTERAKGIAQEMAITALVNLHHSIRGKDCPREAAVGCATSAVIQLKRERDELLAALRGLMCGYGWLQCMCRGNGSYQTDFRSNIPCPDPACIAARAALAKVAPNE